MKTMLQISIIYFFNSHKIIAGKVSEYIDTDSTKCTAVKVS